MGSAVLPHLRTGWHVDQAILSEDDRLVVIRFGRDADPDCMRQDEVLYKIADRVRNFAVIYGGYFDISLLAPLMGEHFETLILHSWNYAFPELTTMNSVRSGRSA